MSRLFLAAVFAALFAVAAPARAFTPESGWWWNPAEPGYGFSIEIQDNFIFMVAFAYGNGGAATWYAAQGEMVDNTFFQAPLYRRDNGTCLGCPFTPAGQPYSAGSNVRVDFLTETTANLTWGGRTIPIQRQDFFLSRTPGVDPKTELWLGEWQVVLDFINVADYEDYPFLGEVLIFDLLDTSGNRDFFEGCRPEDSLVGFCDDFALANHDASGFYSPADGTNIIVVNDSANGWFVYEVEVGTYQFDGYMKSCPKSINNLITQCLDSNNYPVIPVRGWRSASRAYIEGDDDAPNAGGGVTKAARSTDAGRNSIGSRIFQTKAGAPVSAPRVRPDAAATEALLKQAIERMERSPRRSR